MAITAKVNAVRKDVMVSGKTTLRNARYALADGIIDVLDAAIPDRAAFDPRQGILTAVYNYDTESFEIRWDLAK
jgi:hypothetical protein